MGIISNKSIISRHEKLAAEAEVIIDGAVHAAGTLARGTPLQPSGAKWKKWTTGDLAPAQLRILKDEVECDGTDIPAVGYFEGCFLQAAVGLSDADVTTLSLKKITTGEIRLKL